MTRISPNKRVANINGFTVKALVPFQTEVLCSLISGKNVFGCQKTGRGKSLCYQAFTTAITSDDAIVIVVSPLIAIMEQNPHTKHNHYIIVSHTQIMTMMSYYLSPNCSKITVSPLEENILVFHN